MKHKIFTLIAASALFLSACDKGANSSATNADAFANNSSGSGKGGSLARFTIAMNHLYVVDNQKLYTYSLTTGNDPQLKDTKSIGSDIETIYSYKDKLFIGSQSAMYVFSISDEANPSQLGTASHVRACDPVVANDSIAYVTVRTGTNCGGNRNALFVYDVRQVLQPVEKNVVPLENPHGLGMNANRLYVCNGSNGMNVYDITNPLLPKLIKKINDDTYFDVIPTDNLLICMVQGGTVLYQYESTQELVKVAKISN